MSHRKVSAMLPMAFLVLVALGGPATNTAEEKAKLNEDLPAGAMQQKASTACLECHEARIIVQQRLNKATWTKEVDKMIKWGAVVDAGDRDALIDYLSSNFSPDNTPYDPPRSTPQKIASRKNPKPESR